MTSEVKNPRRCKECGRHIYSLHDKAGKDLEDTFMDIFSQAFAIAAQENERPVNNEKEQLYLLDAFHAFEELLFENNIVIKWRFKRDDQ